MQKPMIVDVHLDLSMNAMEWNRDLRKSVQEIRASEELLVDKPDRSKGTVSFESLREGNIGFVVATLIARYVKSHSALPGWNSPEQAWAQTQGQLAWYKEMERQGYMLQIKDKAGLADHLESWQSQSTSVPIGYMLSLEGADSIGSMEHLHMMYNRGLRALGPAHYGPGTYAFGTDSDGSIGEKGRLLLNEMAALDIILDVTHLSDISFWEAIDHFDGPLWASHSNCRSIVPHNRQFTDEQISAIIERGGVIGIPLDAWMMVPNWKRGISTPESTGVSLSHMIDHMDHICQLAGNCNHIGIGTDLDGGFGTEQGPKDLDTIADLQKLPTLLEARGYSAQNVAQILNGNFIDFLKRSLN
ncbi:MAG: membrane dipeptidase [Saprospiraceae bacterium]|jgi:membrane dipeptidase